MVPQSGAEGSSAGTPRCTMSCGCGHGEGQQCSCFSEIDCDVHTTQHIQHAPPARRNLGTRHSKCKCFRPHLRHDLELKLAGCAAVLTRRDVACVPRAAVAAIRAGKCTMGVGMSWHSVHSMTWPQACAACSEHALRHSSICPGRQHESKGAAFGLKCRPHPTNHLQLSPSPAAGMRLQLGHSGRAAASKQYRRHCEGSLPTCRASSNAASWVNAQATHAKLRLCTPKLWHSKAPQASSANL